MTETFSLTHLIGSAPKAVLLQFSFCLLLYNLMQVIKLYVAEDGGVLASAVSMYYLFDDAQGTGGLGLPYRWQLAASAARRGGHAPATSRITQGIMGPDRIHESGGQEATSGTPAAAAPARRTQFRAAGVRGQSQGGNQMSERTPKCDIIRLLPERERGALTQLPQFTGEIFFAR